MVHEVRDDLFGVGIALEPLACELPEVPVQGVGRDDLADRAGLGGTTALAVFIATVEEDAALHHVLLNHVEGGPQVVAAVLVALGDEQGEGIDGAGGEHVVVVDGPRPLGEQFPLVIIEIDGSEVGHALTRPVEVVDHEVEGIEDLVHVRLAVVELGPAVVSALEDETIRADDAEDAHLDFQSAGTVVAVDDDDLRAVIDLANVVGTAHADAMAADLIAPAIRATRLLVESGGRDEAEGRGAFDDLVGAEQLVAARHAREGLVIRDGEDRTNVIEIDGEVSVLGED